MGINSNFPIGSIFQGCHASHKQACEFSGYAATVAIDEGTPTKHVQHHWVHDAVVFKVVSNKHRFGLVAIPYKSITMKVLESH